MSPYDLFIYKRFSHEILMAVKDGDVNKFDLLEV